MGQGVHAREGLKPWDYVPSPSFRRQVVSGARMCITVILHVWSAGRLTPAQARETALRTMCSQGSGWLQRELPHMTHASVVSYR